MKKIIALILAMAMVMALAACGGKTETPESTSTPETNAPASTTETYTLKLGSVMGAATVNGKALTDMADRIKDRTNGQLVVEVHNDGVLGTETQIYESVDMGTIDMALVAIGTQSVSHPELVVEDLPFMFKTREDGYAALDGEYGEAINKVIASDGTIRNLGFLEVGQRQITNSVRPITTPDDLKGVTIRVATSELRLDVFKTLGAEAIAMDWGEVYSALQQGTVDGQECPLNVIYNSSLYDVQKYVSLSGHFWTNNCILINEDSYNKLPDDLKTVLQEEIDAAVDAVRKQNMADDETLVATLESKGMKVNEVDKEAFAKVLEPLYDKWEQKVIGSDLMTAYRHCSGY